MVSTGETGVTVGRGSGWPWGVRIVSYKEAGAEGEGRREIKVGRACFTGEVGVGRAEGGDLHTGPASPSARASLHSKLISNRKGLWKGLGFSSTATFSTETLAIALPDCGRGHSWDRARA